MATKTINLTGAEVAVTGLDGAHAHIRNDGTEVIYAAKTAGITAGADGVASIPAGQSDTIRGISGAVYLLGTGSVLIQSDDYVASPFKTSAASGGSAVDEVARAAINAHSGSAEIHVTAEEKAAWNSKAELTDIPTTLPANGGNADKLDGKHASDFFNNIADLITPESSGKETLAEYISSINSSTSNFYTSSFDDLPTNNWRYNVTVYKAGGAVYVIAYRALSNSEIYVRCFTSSGEWNGDWTRLNDGGNAATLENHPASDFVLKSDYDALAARVAALEGGTT